MTPALDVDHHNSVGGLGPSNAGDMLLSSASLHVATTWNSDALHIWTQRQPSVLTLWLLSLVHESPPDWLSNKTSCQRTFHF